LMDKNSFKDHFSGHSEEYSKYRPEYPAELFKFLSSITPERHLAWDCATGSGQAAHGLVGYFQKVIATDASDQQIKNAVHHKNISYKVAPAHKTTIRTESIDLISAKWTIKQLIGYISTWSAVKRYRNNMGSDPLESIEKELTRLWNIHSEFMDVYWPLSVLIGKKTAT
jgi:hypothetical protein